ncbi:nucleoporin GLE1 [Trichoplusia ni]|uniref:mRNA export factor GLE1 n=1 Tax=Trichoplusia ni TaxID=7111 RepID=A0A7E5WRT8_TRINI|nr:nucleoporin GLE1 [Trichoplusia ni]
MDRSFDISYSSYEDLSRNNSLRKGDISISDQLAGFERLRVSVLTKAAEMSPLVKEVTIGPNSPIKKEYLDLELDAEKEKEEDDFIEDKVPEDLRYTLIMKECENSVKETSTELFSNMVKNMISNYSAFMTRGLNKQRDETQKRTLELLKHLQENDNVTVLKEARLEEKNTQVINTQTIDNMNRILEEQNRAMARLAAMTDSHTKICVCYNEITYILNSEPSAKAVLDKYKLTINAIEGNINHIVNICRSGTLTDVDVKLTKELCVKIEGIKSKVLLEIENVKKEEMAKKQKEEELRRKKEIEEKEAQQALQAAKLAEEAKVKKEQPKATKPTFYSANNYNYYQELKSYLEQYEAQYKDLLQNVNLKKFRFDCQKAVNTPVNALSSVSAVHMRDKYDKLSKLLRGERVQVLDVYVCATQHPQGLAYCTALLAKKIVRQGDLLVSSNTEAAYPLAAVTVALWSQFPKFGKLVEAYFHNLCPYLVPMFLPQKEGQTDKEFYLSRGYTYNDEGVVEKQDKFLKRMSGIFRLRCAIWIAQMPRFLNVPNPHSLRYGWQWLASFLNLKPEPDISATLLHDFFIMCGSKFNQHYGKQFRKILELSNNQYLKILDGIDEGGPKTRLEVYLQTVIKSNSIPPPPASTQINW